LQKSDQNIDTKPAQSLINFSFANIQTKLKVSQPRDIYEQEADRIAEQIIKMSPDSNLASDYSSVDRRCRSKEDSLSSYACSSRFAESAIKSLPTYIT